MTMTAVKQGDILAGKYRIERILGAGAMGVVVAAHHIRLDERVAIKFLRPETRTNPEAVERFDREARSAVKIKSEHVARVIDVGNLDDGAPYMVMEYLEGGDLATWLQQKGPLPVEQAIEFVLQVLEAISEAHSLGIVHRDLKPANLFCVPRADGLFSIKVLDFGISKMRQPGPSSSHVSMTTTAAVMGSPLYMSPEQMQSTRDVDGRADIWAIGVILYELISGRPPFIGASMPELVLRIANGPPDPIAQYRPDVPASVEQIILRCLEKDPDHRYPNVGELAAALVDFAPPRARSSVDRVIRVGQAREDSDTHPPADRRSAGVGSTDGAWGHTHPPPRRTKPAIVGAGIGLLAMVVAGIILWTRSPRATPEVGPGAASGSAAAVAPLREPAAAAPAVSAPSPPAVDVAKSETSSEKIDAPPTTTDREPGSASEPLNAAESAAPSVGFQESSGPLKPSLARGRAAPKTSRPASNAPKIDCDPPYSFDDQGRKKFKSECFLTPSR